MNKDMKAELIDICEPHLNYKDGLKLSAQIILNLIKILISFH